MTNQEIIDQLKSKTPEEHRELINLLEQRWNEFWENDYHTLSRQRAKIEQLERQVEELPRVQELERKLADLHRKPIKRVAHCSGCAAKEEEIAELKARVRQYHRAIGELQRLNAQLEHAKSPFGETEPFIKPGDQIQVIPPFEIWDHCNRPVKVLTVSREVRLARHAELLC